MERAPFIVDLTDPQDIKAKLIEGERIFREIEEQLASLDRLQRESQEWRANVQFLASKIPDAGPNSDAVAETATAPMTAEPKPERGRPLDVVVEVINREVRKIRAIEVHAILAREGHDLAPDQVRNALHYAAHKATPALIQAPPGRGMYAPLAYREVELSTPNGGQPTEVGTSSVRFIGNRLVGNSFVTTPGGALPGR
jgi:hypothetical protein